MAMPIVATAEAYCSARGNSGGDISQSSMACRAGGRGEQVLGVKLALPCCWLSAGREALPKAGILRSTLLVLV